MRVSSRPLSLSTYSYSFLEDKGLILVTKDWTNADWALKSAVRDSCNFPAPHIGGATYNRLFEKICSWKTTLISGSIISEQAAEVFNGTLRLKFRLINWQDRQQALQRFHDIFTARIGKAAVKDSWSIVCEQIVAINYLMNLWQSFVNGLDHFESVTINLEGPNISLRLLDIDTRWS